MKARHEFEGDLWVRPMYRGIELTTDGGHAVNFEDWCAQALGLRPYSGQGGARVRLTLEILSDVEGDAPVPPPPGDHGRAG